MDDTQLIEGLKERIRQKEAELERLRGVLLDMGVSPTASPPPSQSPKPPPAAKKKGGQGRPFSPKYDRPSREFALEELERIHPKGLPLRQLQERLSASGRDYTDQAMLYTLKKLVKDGKLRKTAAPRGSGAKIQYVLVK